MVDPKPRLLLLLVDDLLVIRLSCKTKLLSIMRLAAKKLVQFDEINFENLLYRFYTVLLHIKRMFISDK